jgi:hypothetical protein
VLRCEHADGRRDHQRHVGKRSTRGRPARQQKDPGQPRDGIDGVRVWQPHLGLHRDHERRRAGGRRKAIETQGTAAQIDAEAGDPQVQNTQNLKKPPKRQETEQHERRVQNTVVRIRKQRPSPELQWIPERQFAAGERTTRCRFNRTRDPHVRSRHAGARQRRVTKDRQQRQHDEDEANGRILEEMSTDAMRRADAGIGAPCRRLRRAINATMLTSRTADVARRPQTHAKSTARGYNPK